MVLKLVGSILIIFSSTFIGYTAAGRYARRPLELRTLQSALQMLESEIVFSVNPLPHAFNRIYNSFPGSIGKIFKHSSEALLQRRGLTAHEAWNESLERSTIQMAINSEDKKILREFGSMLGCSDKENQINNIRLTCSKLEIAEKKAELLKEKNERMLKNLGVLGGILAVLLLI